MSIDRVRNLSVTRLVKLDADRGCRRRLPVHGLLGVVMLLMMSIGAIADNDINFDADERALLRAFGPWPQPVPQDPGNALSGLDWAESLGESLFQDTALSGSGLIACSSCHLQALGFTDNRSVAIGAGQHVRNTQGLLDVAQQHAFGWDGGADSLWAASLRPLLSPIEMATDAPTVGTRLRQKADVMGAWRTHGLLDVNAATDDESLMVLAAKTIGAYLRTLRSPTTVFDDFRSALLNGEDIAEADYSRAARRGLKLFLGEAKCHVCHFGPNFSNGEFHDTGRPFYTAVGEVDPGRYSGIQRLKADRYNLLGPFADRLTNSRTQASTRRTRTVTLGQANFGQWRTPSLRNLTHTAPYQHDGSHATLRDVVDAYSDIDPARLHSNGESILQPLSLPERQREDLVAFLESLSVPAGLLPDNNTSQSKQPVE